MQAFSAGIVAVKIAFAALSSESGKPASPPRRTSRDRARRIQTSSGQSAGVLRRSARLPGDRCPTSHTAIFFVNESAASHRPRRTATGSRRAVHRTSRNQLNVGAMRTHHGARRGAGRGGRRRGRRRHPNPGQRSRWPRGPFVELNAGGRGRAATPYRRISRRILHTGLPSATAPPPIASTRTRWGSRMTWRGGAPRARSAGSTCASRRHGLSQYMLYPAAPPDRRQLGSAHHVALLVTDIQQALENRPRAQRNRDRNHRAANRRSASTTLAAQSVRSDGTRVEFMEPWTVR